MKRAIVFLICAILAVTVFAACDDTDNEVGGDNNAPTQSDNEEDDGENTDKNVNENGDLPWGGEDTELPILPFE